MISQVPFLNRKDQSFMVMTAVCLLSTLILGAVKPGLAYVLYSSISAGILTDTAWHLDDVPIPWIRGGVLVYGLLSLIFLVM